MKLPHNGHFCDFTSVTAKYRFDCYDIKILLAILKNSSEDWCNFLKTRRGGISVSAVLDY